MRCVRSRAVQDEGWPPYWLFGQVVRDLTVIMSRTGHSVPTWPCSRPARESGAPPICARRDGRTAVRRVRVGSRVPDGCGGEHRASAGARRRALGGCAVVAADAASGRGNGAARLLLLITYRDTETGGRDELTVFLAALAREDAVSRIRLTGLSQDEVACAARFDHRQCGRARSRGSDRTADTRQPLLRGGARPAALDARLDRPGGLPEAVRDAVRARLDALTPGCRAVLYAAAVLGADLDPAAVAAVTGRDAAAVLAALDEAAAAGIVAAGGGWSFGHDLVRETARPELPTADRLATHARMGSYLKGRPGASPAVVAATRWSRCRSGTPAWPRPGPSWRRRRQCPAGLGGCRGFLCAGASGRAGPARPTGVTAARPGAGPVRGFDLTGGSGTLREAAGAARAAGDPR